MLSLCKNRETYLRPTGTARKVLSVSQKYSAARGTNIALMGSFVIACAKETPMGKVVIDP